MRCEQAELRVKKQTNNNGYSTFACSVPSINIDLESIGMLSFVGNGVVIKKGYCVSFNI